MYTVRNSLEVVFLLFLWQCGNVFANGNPNVNNHTDSVDKEINLLFMSNDTSRSPLPVTNTSKDNGDHTPAPNKLKNESEMSGKNLIRTLGMEGGGLITPQGNIPFTKQNSGSEETSGINAAVTPSVEGVGVLTSESPSTPLVSFKEHIDNSSLTDDSLANIYHSNGNSSIVPRVPQKIHARKGAVLENEIQDETSTKDIDYLSENNKCTLCCSGNNSVVQIKNESGQNCTKCCDVIKNEKVSQTNKLQVNLMPEEPVTHQKENTSDSTQSTTTVTSTTHKKNKKPQATYDISNSPANMSVQQQIQYNSDVSNKTDYVVPAVGIILAIPLVIVLIVILYKKGSEFWERRHYRRMDFLIDGMYND